MVVDRPLVNFIMSVFLCFHTPVLAPDDVVKRLSSFPATSCHGSCSDTTAWRGRAFTSTIHRPLPRHNNQDTTCKRPHPLLSWITQRVRGSGLICILATDLQFMVIRLVTSPHIYMTSLSFPVSNSIVTPHEQR